MFITFKVLDSRFKIECIKYDDLSDLKKAIWAFCEMIFKSSES